MKAAAPDSQSSENALADVALFLEGTYPYVMGGVSAWVDQIIRGLPGLTFALIYIGSQRAQSSKRVYELPPNVVSIHEVFLHDKLDDSELAIRHASRHLRKNIYSRLSSFYHAPSLSEKAAAIWPLIDALLDAGDRYTFGNLARDPEVWSIMTDAYEKFSPEESFIDFFWTTRFLHLPLWNLLRLAETVPRARVCHSVSAGYSGLLAAIAARRWNVKMFLTEHGIYTKERIAEISQAKWIYEGDAGDLESLGKLKQLWIGLFLLLGNVAYDEAARIVTLYEGNAQTQVEFGADEEKIDIIPNGIDLEEFDEVREQVRARWNPAPEVKTVGFVGRIVPIKDVKTLLRAARLVCEDCPEARFLLAGPTSEDPLYYEECQKITQLLEIENRVQFLGPRKLMEILPEMDVMVLTSISEGLPLVILEAMAASIPIVATDVGACRELIFGRAPEDKAIGVSGRLTKILSPQQTAHALLDILNHPERWRAMGEAGHRRVAGFYTMRRLLGAYGDYYRGLAGTPSASPRRLAQQDSLNQAS